MAHYFSLAQSEETSEESLTFLSGEEKPRSGNWSKRNLRVIHDVVAYSIIVVLTIGLLATVYSRKQHCLDPSVGLYCRPLGNASLSENGITLTYQGSSCASRDFLRASYLWKVF